MFELEKRALHSDAAAACQRGNELRANESLEQAAWEFERALLADPRCYDALLGLAHVRSAQARYDDAVTHLGQLTLEYPKAPEPWRVLGSVLIDAGRASEALAPMERHASLVPHDERAQLRCAELALDLGLEDRAAPLIRLVKSMDPSNPGAGFLEGRVLFEGGNTESAIGRYRDAVLAAPHMAEPRGARIAEAWLMPFPGWAKSGLGQCHVLAPPSVIELPVPPVVPRRESHYWPAQSVRIPEVFVGIINDAEVYTPEYTIRGPDGIFFVEGFVTSPTVYPHKGGIVKYASRDGRVLLDLPHVSLDVRTTCAVLGRSNNYFHFLLESLPRIWSLERLGMSQTVPVLVPADLYDTELELLALLGFPDQRLIKVPNGAAVHCQTLYAPSLFGQGYVISPLAVQFLRERVLPRIAQLPDVPRRAYLSRNRMPRRHVRNEHELREKLDKHGFITVYPEELGLAAQINLFARAEVILTADSSALANLAFAAPTANIGVFSRRGLYKPLWHCIASHVGTRLTYIHADAIINSNTNLAHCDMHVEPALIDEWLETLQ